MEEQARYRGFLENTLLFGIDELINAKREGRVLIRVAGLPYEVYELLLQASCTSLPDSYLPARIKQQFDLNDPEFLDYFRGVIENLLTLQEETFEKDITQRGLPEIVAAWEKARELSETVEKKDVPLWKKQIEEHNKEVLSFKKALAEGLAKEFTKENLTQEKAKIIIEETSEEIEKALRETRAPQEPIRNATVRELRKNFAAAGLLTAEVRDHLTQFETSPTPFGKGIDRHLAEVSLAAQTTGDQARRIKSLNEIFERRAKLAAKVFPLLDPKLVENPDFRRDFGDIFSTADPAIISSPQKFIEGQIVACAEKAGIKKIEEKPIAEYASQIAKEVPKDFFSRPDVPPFHRLEPPSPLLKAEEVVKTSLEKHLEEVPYAADQIEGVATAVLEEATQPAALDSFLSLEAEGRRERISSFVDSSLTAGALELPEENRDKILESLTKDLLPQLSPYLVKEQESLSRLQRDLEQIASTPGLFFSSLFPWPLKPVGFLMDLAGTISPKMRHWLLLGVFGNDPEKLAQVEKHFLALARKKSREADLEKKLFGKNEEVSRLSKEGDNYGSIANFLFSVKKESASPSFLSGPFISSSRFLINLSRRIDRRFPNPLGVFERIKNLRFAFPTPPFNQALNKFSGVLLDLFKPHLFATDTLGKVYFNPSLLGIKIGLGNFLSGVKNFFAEKIFNLSFFQGIKALGGNLLAKLGLGGLAKIGLSLGIKALGATLSAGATLLIEGGLSLVRGAFNFLTGGLLGPRGEERGEGFVARLGSDPVLALPVIAVAAVVGIIVLSILSSSQVATSFTAKPYSLQKGTPLGVMEEKIATPSATPTLTSQPQ